MNAVTGGMITNNFVKSVEKGVREACAEGALSGHKVSGIRLVEGYTQKLLSSAYPMFYTLHCIVYSYTVM